MRLRDTMRTIGTMKHDERHEERPFGGLNVIFCGDFWQLDPPEPKAWSLSRIPASFFHGYPPKTPAPTAEHGLSCFWSTDKHVGLTGLTELVQQERFEVDGIIDDWCSSLLGGCRDGNRGDDTFNFLHGRPTSVPGS